MLEIVCYDSDGRVIDHLTQWDVGQSVSVRGATYSGDPVFHFCNRRSYEALVVTAKNVDGALVADIPNVLLTESLPIEIYMYYQQNPGSAKTVYTISIPVEQRKKPTDYIFEDNVDYVGLVEINKQMSAALAEVRKAVDEVKTAVSLVDGVIGSAQSATNDANTAAALANTAAGKATTASGEAKAATQAATTAATEAITSKNAADESTRNANLAAENANEAATKANEAAQNATINLEEVKKDVGNKLDKPTAQPTAGQILKVRSTNPDGSFVVEWADDGGGTVQDVQINGVTIVQDGVANVQLSNGLTHNAALGIATPTQEQISGRNPAVAITGATLDNAVKAAMCDGKGPAWTADEQVAARDRMGIENLPLIAEATVETPVKKITIANSSDGKSLNLRECIVLVDAGAGTGIISVDTYNSSVYSVVSRIKLSLNETGKTYIGVYNKGLGNGTFVSLGCDLGKTSSEYYGKPVNGCILTKLSSDSTIRKMELACFTAENIPAGTNITVYGVRV